jgi:hypothetical protein
MAPTTPLDLCPGEKVLLEVNGGVLTLTTHRVRMDDSARGGRHLISMTLSSVESCGIVTHSNPFLIFLSLGLALGAVLVGQQLVEVAATLLLGGALSVGAYFATRRVVLAISSAAEKIVVPVSGNGRESLVRFVDSLERAKLEREAVLVLHGGAASGLIRKTTHHTL